MVVSLRTAVVAGGLALGAPTAEAQARHEIISGRIATDSARPVAGAMVRTLRAPDRALKSAVTDAGGVYSIDWSDGSGDYLISVSAAGLPTVTRRITRTGTDSVITFDALLTNTPRVQRLPASVTQAARSAPTRNDDPEIGGTSSGVPWYRRMPPELNGDLAAMAALLPGMMSTPAGSSVLGLSPNQNSVTMNGLAFAGGQVPRDARTAITVSASTYDPANGWFSGARTNVSVVPGGLLSHGTAHFTADAPSLQSTDPIASRLGQRYTNLNGSVGMTGALLDDRLEYNFGLQGGRRSANVASLISADSYLLQHAGVAKDSASRLLQLLRTAGVPTAGATSSLNDNVVFLGRINQSRFDWATNKPVPRTWSLIAYGNYARNQAQGVGPTSTPAHAGTTSQGIGSLTGDYSFYFHKDWLGDVRSGFTLAHNASQPYVQLPDGRVLVTSYFDDGTAGTTPLSFGGNPGMHSDTRQWTWESTAEIQFFPPTLSRHRVKLNADSRLDGYRQDLAGNQLGTFSFNSLADLASNQPSSFTRTLNAPLRTSGEWNGYLALGDLWRPSQNVQLIYGGRIEASAFTSHPAFNPAIQSTFGARTDAAPSTLHFSPRFGFTVNRPGKSGKPSGAIRGGIGELRNLVDPALLAGPSVANGLPGGLSRLTCIGSAVPSPDWSAYENSVENIPSSCAGSPVASYTDGAPSVQLIDPEYQPQRSWRANLSWTSTLWRRTVYSLEAIHSLNLSQPGTVDLNFVGTSRFTTADESRPVFANVGSVVPSTGVVSAVDARRSTAFGRVANNVSDLRSSTTQTRLTLRPDIGPLGLYLRDASVAYVFSNTRAQQRGFNAPAFGDPSQRAWSRGDFDVRHQFTMQTIYWPRGTRPGPGFFFYGHVQSGLPFTPVIATDVNGDGLANDRGFVFAPSQTSDTAVANGIDRLRTSSSHIVGHCIARNLGRVAERNGCEGRGRPRST
jgi:hypothetical protein